MAEAGDANRGWAESLGRWAIPETLIAAAAASPYFFDPQLFVEAADEALARNEDTVSDAVARDALPSGGSVLDVGVGAGAASLRLGAARVIGVDSSRAMLDAFVPRAAHLGVEASVVEGTWPAVAHDTPPVDVAVCHHVVYNVADLAAFAAALDDHASTRVIIELTAVHPMAWLAPYWETLHGLRRPDGPTVDDAVAVLIELGLDVHQERWVRRLQMIGESGAGQLGRIARRLCLPPARHDELRQLLATTPPPRDREVVTVWW